MDENVVRRSIKQIIDTDVDDECYFEITNISEIRHEEKYDGLRVTILGMFHSLRFHIKLDLSTGDKITPSPVKRVFRLNIVGKDIELYAYNFETVLAEKLQTIISRGIATTRAKDYFDVCSIMNMHKNQIDSKLLDKAFEETMMHRNSKYSKEEMIDILNMINKSEEMNELWSKYKDDHPYVNNLEFRVVYSEVKKIVMELIETW